MITKLDSFFIVLFLLILFLAEGGSIDLRPCDDTDLVNEYCGLNETCESGYCHCLPGYIRVNSTTQCAYDTRADNSQTSKPSKFTDNENENTSKSHLAESILIPTLFIIIIVICSIYFIRKYRLVNYIRNKISSQRSIAYDEVMIGRDLEDDDPPLT